MKDGGICFIPVKFNLDLNQNFSIKFYFNNFFENKVKMHFLKVKIPFLKVKMHFLNFKYFFFLKFWSEFSNAETQLLGPGKVKNSL